MRALRPPIRTAVTLVVPFAPAGPTDIIARILANAVSAQLGRQLVVENRPGAAGNTGMGQVARAKPDGYTLLLTSTAIAVNPALFKSLPYDPFKDFAPISELVAAPNVIVVRLDSGINSIADLVAQAKAKPGTFNYSSPGAGTKSHLTGELLKLRAGIEMQHVPYRGAGPAAVAVLEGTVQVGSVALPAAEPLVKSGQLRALAVTGGKRWFSLPDVPTMIEFGFPGFISETFNALFAPAGTPPEIIAIWVKTSARRSSGRRRSSRRASSATKLSQEPPTADDQAACRRDCGRQGTGREGRHQTGKLTARGARAAGRKPTILLARMAREHP